MKKTLTAFAALAVCGLASAQSSVTLFGVVDAGVTYQSATSRDATTGASIKQSKTSLSNSGYNSSRIGFRGTEDLGGGLAASFWLEAPITNDDGATGISTFSRRSTVSLSGNFGELRLGRDYTATFWNDTVFDPFGTNGSGSSVINTVSGSTGLNNANYVRASNAVGYFLPPNLGGFYGQLQYSFHENTSTDATSTTAATSSSAGRYVGGRFGYANGPLDVALAVGQNVAADTTTLERKVQTINLGASYDFGPVKLFGELSNVKNKFNTALSNTHDSYNGYLFGATVPVGAGLIRASYSVVRYNEGAAGITGEDPRAQKLAIGYVHNLSKRTALYATVARVNNRNDANYTGSLVSASTTGYGSAGVGYTGLPRSSTGYDFGIRHAF
ncbi:MULTISPECIES: porin [unclassified Variovorax]|jgi:predicted porin|uniref:porin n=3 Tax=Variovorax TaxID=34072 RepID=UPI0008C15AD5|nr:MULTISPECIES: porin [unclassified Variovorax]SEK13834.1 Outer membrane protein (porin) [Variovorax sp. OK202]SEK13966.1 Outer membrane protein (porin) [Variovorax sp. OK202]SFD92043.1 Outer membrane protein (porin) [Variovorax sp. OK212]SFD93453.1 Outer membrane protein (porin) [Variovorax sp. OK212]